MTTLLQQILNGISLGSAYALFAVGFTLIFGVNRILNLAHGAVFTWGALAGYFVALQFGGWFPSILAGALAGGLLSVAIDLLAFRPLRKKAAPEFATLVTSLGALMILQNLALRVTEAKYLRFPGDVLPGAAITLGPLRLSNSQVAILATSLVLAGAVVVYLRRTRFGTQVRATAVDERAASLLGISPSWVHFQTFFVSGAVAGVAGVVIAMSFNSVHFLMGEPYLLNGLAVIILGGMGSIGGALIGGILFGVIHALTIQYVSTSLAQIAPFMLIVAVLLVRPTGLYGSAINAARVGRT